MGATIAILVASALPLPFSWLKSAGPLITFIVFGIPALCESLSHEMDIHVLMSAAAFASAFIGHASEGATLLVLFAISGLVEERLSTRAQKSLDALNRMNPETAHRLPSNAGTLGASDDAVEVPASDLRVGDLILVRAGEVVPVDGEVVDGVSQVGLDHLTGEPLPKPVAAGDQVLSGAINMDGAMILCVKRRAEESTIQRIVRLTAEAKSTRPQLVTFVDAIGSKWTYGVVWSTVAVALIPIVFLGSPWRVSLYRSLVWLITASPCALILAAPLVYVSALSVAATNGMLLRGGRTLDALATASGFAFDKTGTLTNGAPILEAIEPVGATLDTEANRQQAMRAASALGRLSVHPVSRALAKLSPAGSPQAEVSSFQMAAGAGLRGQVVCSGHDPLHVFLGKPEFVADCLRAGSADSKLKDTTEESETAAAVMAAAAAAAAGNSAKQESTPSGGIITALGLQTTDSTDANKQATSAWLLRFTNRVKTSASEVVSDLSQEGPVYMLTGDRAANARCTANELGGDGIFTEVHADLRPEEKLQKVREYDQALRAKADADNSINARMLRALGVSRGGLVMVGDGVNDGPALAAATVGVSLAATEDGAIPTNAVEGSDVIVLGRQDDPAGDNDLARVRWLLGVARKSRVVVQQNLAVALGSIIFGSCSALFLDLPLRLGVILHEGTTVLVALNSLRLFPSFHLKWRSSLRRHKK